ncbi:MAG: hypothetical protein CMG71_00770 [Candidatus Marinimicrobia bacterium]|nr:hypothetical protein [Candidatus Neomarinimicrobiota bacterium]
MRFLELTDIMASNGVYSLAEIARELRVSPQSVSNWKARDRVPYKIVLELQNRFDTASNGQSVEGDGSARIQEDFKQQGTRSRMKLGELPTFLMEEEKVFSLAEFLMPVAQNLKFIIKSGVVMASVGFLIVLVSTLLSFISQEEPEEIYVTKAKIVIPGGISLPGGDDGGGAAGILGQLGINVPGAGGGGGASPTSSLTSPSLYPAFLSTRSFAKRLLGQTFHTEKYGEQTLLEIALREKEEKLNKQGLNPWQNPEEPSIFDRNQGQDTLVMQHMGVLEGMIQFSQEGPFQSITTHAIEPQLAVEIAYVVLDELQAFTEYFMRVDLDKTQTFIEQRLEVVEDEYETLEEEMKVFLETNRVISGHALRLQQERLTRDLQIYKGIYTTLYQNLEQVKIQKEYELSPTIQILDYPIAPLAPTVINDGATTTQNPVFIVLLAVAGIGFGVVVFLAKGYFFAVEENEKPRLRDVKKEAELTLKSVFQSVKIGAFFRRKRSFRD